MSDLVRVSVSIERPLLERLEELLADSDHTNRSEFVRDLIRGRGKDIRALADRLHREKGVLHAKLATGTTGKDLPRRRAKGG